MDEVKNIYNVKKSNLKENILPSKNPVIKLENEEFEIQNFLLNTNDGIKIEKEAIRTNYNVLKWKDTKGDVKNLDLCSSVYGDDFNVTVQIKNESTFQNEQRPVNRIIRKKDRSNSSIRYKSKSENFVRRERPINQGNRSNRRARSRRRSRWSGNNVHDSRSRRNCSSEHSIKSKSSKSLETINKSESSRSKDRKTKAGSLESFDHHSGKSYPKRKSAFRKRTRIGASPVQNCLPPKEVGKKVSANDKTVRDYERSPSVLKKDIMELEKRTESVPNSTEEVVNFLTSQYSSYPATPVMPVMSVDNLPLVPGPNGLPVHITVTGQHILHDMAGRPIPIGPNGYYLPLDPTGCLYPHIISPGNQAVPIHMTEDGVLRLPNSEPVPYGPGHQFPVHVDGSIIFIGADSRPIYPCYNLPKEPPLILRMMEPTNAGHVANEQVAPIISEIPEVGNQQNYNAQPQEPQSTIQTNIQPSRTDHSLMESQYNSSEKVSKIHSMQKYKQNVPERNEDVLRPLENEKTLSSNSSKREVQRSAINKLLQDNIFRNESCRYSSDTVIDSSDSGSIYSLKITPESKKVATEEIALSSDVNKVSRIVCDSENQKTQKKERKREHPITEKVNQTLKLLREKNYKPPALGRFFVTNLMAKPELKMSPNESPLLRNRIQLPFLTPKTKDVSTGDQSVITKSAAVTFRFLPQKKSFKTNEMHSDLKRNKVTSDSNGVTKPPLSTLDFSTQCDFTSPVVKDLSSKISHLEKEVVRLKSVNANLLDGYKNVQALNQKKNDRLKKFTLEIEEKNNKILKLKRLLDKKHDRY